jgi:hypothetical protein
MTDATSGKKIIGLEEHFVTKDVMSAWQALEPQWQDVALKQSDGGGTGRRLFDPAAGRIAAGDHGGDFGHAVGDLLGAAFSKHSLFLAKKRL